MFILYFLLILLIVLLVFIMTSTIIRLTLFCTTRYKYNDGLLILPTFLSIISWIFVISIWYIIITYVLNINLIDLLLNSILKISKLPENIFSIILITIGFIVIAILLQALSYLTVNIDYTKLSGKIRMLFKKIFKSQKNDNPNEEFITEFQEHKRLTFLNALASSIFAFSVIFFTFILCFVLGHVLGKKFI